ncbi:nitric oxide reductase F protein [Thioclava sp. GXIMD4215]|uniref:nitric oxide reductase F protein n=1 Tax=Thioclava sp. GXIMD4215 TaxID=3131928 RepID=UPI00311AC462
MSDPLIRAWVWLVALSTASTILAILVSHGVLTGAGVTAGGAAILALAWAKAEVILARYLGLAAAPFWHRGFRLVLGLYAAGLLGLYLLG